MGPHFLQSSSFRLAWAIIASISLVVSIGLNIVQYRQIELFENPALLAQERLKQYVKEISKVIVLPPDEVPTLATVSDPAELVGQPFFARAAVGDIVLVYEKSKRAILWRPSEKKLIEVSSAIVPASQTTPERGR